MNNEQHFELFKKTGGIMLLKRKEFVAMIPRIYKNKIYRRKGFGSIFECAAKIGGISKNMVEEVLRIDEKLKNMPELRSKIKTVGLSKVRRVANLATKETDSDWAKDVEQLTKTALETKVRDIRNSMPGPGIPNTTQEVDFDNDHENFSIKLDPKLILKLKIIKNKMKKGTTWNEVFKKLTNLPTSKPQQNPRPSNPKSRPVSAKKRRDAFEKTNGQCGMKGCSKPATQIHHGRPWAIFKSHEKLEPLCGDHHELEHQTNSTVDTKFRAYKMQAVMF